jgi:hypothetical protein
MTTSENHKKAAFSTKQLVAGVVGTVALSVLVDKSRDWAKDYQTWLNWCLIAIIISVSAALASALFRWSRSRMSNAKRQ